MVEAGSTITALLGPTNTGKTHRAVERMLDFDSGIIGLPLRLLAREIYDRVSTRLGERQVALVTGEEKRVPRAPRYWVCTVEAMPMDLEVDFLAVDEIQLAAHHQRGHVFTDRLLRARGRRETWFMGAATMREMVAELVPTASFRGHPRFSRLTAAGQRPLSQLPPRTAFLSFLGLGTQEPLASWGLLAAGGAETMEVFPWLLVFPAVMLALTLFCLNHVGDGLRDALDPRMRKD